MPAADVLGIDAVTFALSAATVAALVPAAAQPQHPRRGEDPVAYQTSLGEGFRHLLGDRLLVAIAAMVLVTNFVDQAGSAVLIPVWAHDIIHSSVALGLVGAALSLGAVAGNAVTTWLAPRLPRRATYAFGFFVAGAPRFVALALLASLSPVLAVNFVSGLGAGAINPVLGATEYERVPRHLQARVLGAVGASAWAGIPLGSLAGGLLVSAAGVRIALACAAGLYGLATLPRSCSPSGDRWTTRHRPDPLSTNTQIGVDTARTGRSEHQRRPSDGSTTEARSCAGTPAALQDHLGDRDAFIGGSLRRLVTKGWLQPHRFHRLGCSSKRRAARTSSAPSELSGLIAALGVVSQLFDHLVGDRLTSLGLPRGACSICAGHQS